ncbi:hypothetical protein OR1_03597 [Geobacter sp. OR-1]|uniref:LysM peptidoglycan-binding domain-containing protein n=1 Tax=Geobacter sp. OR-1 TaxID=1266765 RepID=UPI000542AA1B|nr:LysM domain-containing protein [Geobacter sp. OR-1]GAM11286.1 hypothetical protein OR1_03597 [Geobacter sp. OR-1]
MSCNRSETKPAVHKSGTPGLIAFLAVIICMAGRISAAGAAAPGAQFEIDLKELDKLKTAPKQEPARPRKEAAARAAEKRTEAPRPLKGNVTYTVKPGDNLFKILMRDFGMSNREAELRIPELVRINGLSGSTRLTVGSKLVIPAERQAREHHHRQPRHEETRAPKTETPAAEAAPAEPAPPVAAPVPQEPSSTVPAHVAVKSITGAAPYQALDQLLAALSLQWERDKVIEGTIAPQNPGELQHQGRLLPGT